MTDNRNGRQMPATALLRVAAMIGLLLALATPATARTVSVDQPAPHLELRDLQDRLFRLSDVAYPGRERSWCPKSFVLLDFFRTDCPKCVAALPDVVRLHHSAKDRGLKVVLVAVLEPGENDEDLQEFLKKKPLPFQVVVDAHRVAAAKYTSEGDQVSVPLYVLVDPAGIVRSVGKTIDPATIERLLGDLQRKMADGTSR